MKRYQGERDQETGDTTIVVIVDDTAEGARVRELPLRLDLRDHSPTGFEWGYGGSGPAQTALAILADCVGDELAQVHYMDFKFKVVGSLGPTWTLTEDQVRCFIAARSPLTAAS